MQTISLKNPTGSRLHSASFFRRFSAAAALFAALAVLLAAPRAHAQLSFTWANGSGTTNWNAAADWKNTAATGTYPGSATTGTTDIAVFSGAEVSNPILSSTVSIGQINFSTAATSGYTISGSAITLGVGQNGSLVITGTNTSGVNTISANIIFGGNANHNESIGVATGGTLAISGNISATNSGVGLNLDTSGNTAVYTLSGSNSYTGNTVQSWETLNINNNYALGTGTLTEGNNGFINNTSGSAVTVANGIFVNNAGPITFIGSNNLTFNGASVYTGANLQLAVNSGTLGFGGAISGTYNIIQTGTGVLYFTGSNTYTGTTTVDSGTLQVGTGGNLAAGVAVILGGSSGKAGVLELGDATGAVSPVAFGSLAAGSGTAQVVGDSSGTSTLSINPTGGDSFGGVIGGVGTNQNHLALAVGGAGTLTLSAAETYTGSTGISGALTLTGTLGSGGGTAITNGGVLSESALGVIAGTSTLVNTAGSGTLTGVNTYTGSTAVTGGALTINGAGSINSSGTISINGSGAELIQASSVAITPTVTVTQGTLLGSGTVNTVNVGAGTGGIVGNSGTSAPLTIGTLTFNGAGAMTLTMVGGTNTTFVPVATTTLTTQATHNGEITINFAGGVLTSGSTYGLASYTTLTGNATDFSIGTGLSPRAVLASTFTAGASYLTLTVGASDSPVWTGTASGIWTTGVTGTTGATPNWALLNGHTATDFWAGDTVQFNDTYQLGATTGLIPTTSVEISGTVAPTSVIFNNNILSYTLTGSNAGSGIVGIGSLTMNGSRSVILSSSNSYTGATNVNSGTLALVAGSLKGTAIAVAAGANFSEDSASAISGSASLANSGTSSLAGNNTYTGATTVTSGVVTLTGTLNGTPIAVNGGTFTESGSGVISGASSFTNSVNVTLANANTYTGTTKLAGGVLTLGNASALGGGGNITFAGGTLQYSASNNADYSGKIVSSGSAISIDVNGRSVTYASALSSSNTGGLTLQATGGGQLTLNAYSTYTGGTIVNSGTLVLDNGGSTGSILGVITINAGGTVNLNAGNTLGYNTNGTQVTTVNINGGVLNISAAGEDGYSTNFVLTGGTMTAVAGGYYSFGGNGGANVTSLASTVTSVVSGSISLQGSGTFNVASGTTPSGIDLLVSAPISSNAITKAGTGVLALTGANVYTNVTTISAGTLQLGTGTSGSDGTIAGASIVDQASLVYDYAGGQTYTGVISGSGNVAATGTGSVTLTGSNTYTGTTNVTRGAFILGSAGAVNTSAAININGSGAKFVQASSVAVTPVVTVTQGEVAGTGTINTVNVANSIAAIVGNGSTASPTGTLTIGALTFSGSATLDLSPIGGATTATAPLVVTGALTSSGAGTGEITINLTPGTAFNNTTYDLIGYGSLVTTGTADFQIGTGLTSRQSATFGNTGSFITLTIAGDSPKWTGLDNGNWVVGTTGPNHNWQLITEGSPTDYIQGDVVLFDDSGSAQPTVNISAANVSPTSTTFNNNAVNYTITSSGGFGIAAGSLTMNGSGTTTIATNNTYAGPTNINAGTLVLTGTLAGTPVTVGSGTSGATFNLSGGLLNGTPVTVAATGTFTESGGASISGTSAFTDSGSATLTNNNSYTGATTINQTSLSVGVLAVGGSNSTIGASSNGAGNLVLNSGTLVYTGISGTTNRSFTIGSGSSAEIDISSASANLTITGAAAATSGTLVTGGAGTLTLSGNNAHTGGTIVNSGTLALNAGGSTATITGTLTINAGAVVNLLAADSLGYGVGTSVTTVNINGGSLVNVNNNNEGYLASFILNSGTMNSLAGGAYNIYSGSIASIASSGTSVINAPIAVRGSGLTITTASGSTPGGIDLLMSGTIGTYSLGTGAIALTKAGAGALQLNSNSVYSGTTTVAQGNLVVTNSAGSATGSSVVNITPNASAPATLSGNGTISGLVTTTTGAGANVAHIAPGVSGVGTLTLNGGLTIGNGTNLDFTLGSSQGLIATTALSLGNNIVVNVTQGGGFAANTVYNLITYTGGSATYTGAANLAGANWSVVGTPGGDTAVFNDTSTAITLEFVSAGGNDSTLVITPTPAGPSYISLGSVLVGYTPASTTVTGSNGGMTGTGTYATATTGLVSVTPTNPVIAPSGTAGFTVSATGTVSGPSGNNTVLGTLAATNSANSSGSLAPVNVTANVYEAFSGSTASTINSGTSATLNLMNELNDDGAGGQRAGVTIVGYSTTNTNFAVTTDNGGVVGTASGGSNSALTDVGTVTVANNLLSGTYNYSGNVTGTANYTDTALQSQGGSSLTNPVWSGITLTGTVSASVGYGVQRQAFVASGNSLTGYGLTSNTGFHSTAVFLNGTTSADTTVTMQFTANGGHPVNPFQSSDTLSLAGLNPVTYGGQSTGPDGSIFTDAYVLQLSSTAAGYIAWWDANTDQILGNGSWVNAIAGNSNAVLPRDYIGTGAFAGTYAQYLTANSYTLATPLSDELGAYGVYFDGTSYQEWAVLDHNSDFEVIPEPSTYAMIFSGFGMLIGFRRLRRRSSRGK